jgi:hypothetical protein
VHVEIRLSQAAAKICMAFLLEVAPIALVVTGTVAQAPLFAAIDLTPGGFTDSSASGISGDQQVVGYGNGHALLWYANAASVVDLNPSVSRSEAFSVCGGQQVGDIWVAYGQSGSEATSGGDIGSCQS